LKSFHKNLEKNKFNWVTYLSATSVYGDKKGQWVDEETSLKPISKRGIARLNAETNWLKYYKDHNLPVQIFRLSGIYSIENNVIKRLKMETLKIVEKNNHSQIIQQKHDYFLKNSMLSDCYFYFGYINKENFVKIKNTLNRKQDLIYILKIAFDIESDSNLLLQQAELVQKSCNEILEIVSKA